MMKVVNSKERKRIRFLNALKNDNRFKTIYLDWRLHKNKYFPSFRVAYKTYYNGVMRIGEDYRKLQEFIKKVDNLLSKGKEVYL